MAAENSIQSLDRGLAVLKMLSRTPSMTATAIAVELGIHQSSASRLLNSLLKAGFVRKPEFHSFALDYGALSFAGYALNCFPEIKTCTTACNQISSQYGFNAAAGILRDERILYLTQISDNAAISILDDTGFPLHQSSLGLALACEKEKDDAKELITASLRRYYQESQSTFSEEKVIQEAEGIYATTQENLDTHGLLYQTDTPANIVNAAMTFDMGNERAAVAVYHPVKSAPIGQTRRMLQQMVEFISSSLGKTQNVSLR